jgi:hypothetical protein
MDYGFIEESRENLIKLIIQLINLNGMVTDRSVLYSTEGFNSVLNVSPFM